MGPVPFTHVKNHVVGQGRGKNDGVVTTINGICPWSSPTDDTCIPYYVVSLPSHDEDCKMCEEITKNFTI